MEMASLSTRLNRPETLWQWLCLMTQICLGWVSLTQLEAMFASDEADDGSLVVYDANGNAHVFLSDAAAGRRASVQPSVFGQALDEGLLDARECAVLDVALMKPSCCEAPSGLCHFWDLPKRIGDVLAFLKLRPALTSDPGLVFLAHGWSSLCSGLRGRGASAPNHTCGLFSEAIAPTAPDRASAGSLEPVPCAVRRGNNRNAPPSRRWREAHHRERKQAPTGVGRAGAAIKAAIDFTGYIR